MYLIKFPPFYSLWLWEICYYWPIQCNHMDDMTCTQLTPRLTLNQSQSTVGWESTFLSNEYIWVTRHSADYQPAIDQVLIECQPSYGLGCQLGIDWDDTLPDCRLFNRIMSPFPSLLTIIQVNLSDIRATQSANFHYG